ncbi:Zinc finger protein ZAT4 [Spatholobus suberectus]|nr:Zinc finger protein ZAT4 [Spatholobus suberectus]
MKEDQEMKHACKFCSKSFPCGRSLGGHMRSHVTNVSTETEKLSSFNGGGDIGTGSSEGGTNNGGYGLRENPKKTWRFTDSSEDTLLVLDKLCKECGKGFHSWKALFGHMKCHSERVTQNNSLLEDQDSWTDNTNAEQKMLLDSHSDNEAIAPNRRRRSKRRRTRYMAPSTSSVSFVSEAEQEQEQEEVAMSLIMLSRDMSPWCGLNPVNSLHLEAPLITTNLDSKVEGKRVMSNTKTVTKPRDMKWESGNLDASNLNSKGKISSELLGTESPGSGFGVNKTMVSNSAFEDNGTDDNSNKYTSIKEKFKDSELRSSSLKSWVNKKPSEAELSKSSNKRGKFECTTCKKIFHSYQALGGHRASHKKIKGCFASKNESSENSTELEADLSPDPTPESKLLKNEYVEEHEMVTVTDTTTGFDNKADTVRESKKGKGHECPICLKVFPSGQALGGHKRSHHLAGGSESARNCQSQTVVLEGAAPEIRDFFDLNLPASTEEEGNSHSHAEPYRPWWVVRGSHKQEALGQLHGAAYKTALAGRARGFDHWHSMGEALIYLAVVAGNVAVL